MSRIASHAMIIIVLALPAGAQGWNDYSYEIGDGFMIVRGNHIDIGVVAPDNSVISGFLNDLPEDASEKEFARSLEARGDHTLRDYMVTDRYIFTRCQRDEVTLVGDDAWPTAAHYQVSSYLVIDKQGWEMFRDQREYVHGPMSLDEFLNYPAVTSIGTIEWVQPQNPNADLLHAIRWAIYFVLLLPVYILLRMIVTGVFLFIKPAPQELPEDGIQTE